MEWLHYIATPLVGGFIGLITNGIAIKMLFRPHYPVKIGNIKLPFTPGLIPKEKPRIAKMHRQHPHKIRQGFEASKQAQAGTRKRQN